MELNTDVIIYYLKMVANNICVYYCFEKIMNIKENRFRNYLILVPIIVILLFAYIPIRTYTNSLVPFIIFGFIFAITISRLTKNKIGYSIIITTISYAITFVCQGIRSCCTVLPI